MRLRDYAWALQIAAFKGTLLILLAMGAISPIFRNDLSAICVCAFCVAVLTILASFTLFRRERS
jgi:hypothetical protein